MRRHEQTAHCDRPPSRDNPAFWGAVRVDYKMIEHKPQAARARRARKNEAFPDPQNARGRGRTEATRHSDWSNEHLNPTGPIQTKAARQSDRRKQSKPRFVQRSKKRCTIPSQTAAESSGTEKTDTLLRICSPPGTYIVRGIRSLATRGDQRCCVTTCFGQIFRKKPTEMHPPHTSLGASGPWPPVGIKGAALLHVLPRFFGKRPPRPQPLIPR